MTSMRLNHLLRSGRALMSIAAAALLGLTSQVQAADPTITNVGNTSTDEDTPTAIGFTVTDADENNANLVVTASSSNANVVASNAAALTVTSGSGSSGGARTLTVNPVANAFGTTTITLTVRDTDGNTASDTFVLTVNSVNDLPTITDVANQTTAEDQAKVVTFTVSDIETSASALTVTGSSSRTGLVANSGIVVENLGAGSRRVTLTPVANQNDDLAGGTATITLTVTDGNSGSASDTFTLSVSAVDDAPVITGSVATTANDTALGALFGSIGITEVDGEDVTVTVNLGTGAIGEIVTVGGGGSTTAQSLPWSSGERTPSQAQSALRALRYELEENTVSVGDYPVVVTLSVVDENGTHAAANGNTTVTVSSVNDPPVVTLTASPNQISDNRTVRPFQITVTDVDLDESFELVIEETTNHGTLSSEGPFEGTEAQLQTALANVAFNPLAQVGRVTASFRASVKDIHPPIPPSLDQERETTAVTATAAIDIEGINHPPEIVGVVGTNIQITDDPADVAMPFADVIIADADLTQVLTVSLSLDDPEKGTLSATSNSGTASELTEWIRAVTFVATPNRIPVNEIENVRLTISVFDGAVSRTNNQTVVVVTSIDGPPVFEYGGSLTFPSGPVLIPPTAVLTPFTPVGLMDDDPTSALTVTVALDDAAKGTLFQAMPMATAVEGYADASGKLLVRSPGHGLAVGQFVVISGSGRTASYDGLHEVMSVAADTFTLTTTYTSLPDTEPKGVWVPVAPVTSYADDGGRVRVTSSGHGLAVGQLVSIAGSGTVSTTYDGVHRIVAATSNTFTLDLPFIGTLASDPQGAWLGLEEVSGDFSFTGAAAEAAFAVQSLVFETSATYEFPPTSPGGTTFTLTAVDPSLNSDSQELSILIQNEPRTHLVTSTDDDAGQPGTLRYAVAKAENNDTIAFALPSYPARIRLDASNGPLVLERNVTLAGPGADLMEISGDTTGDGVQDVQIFRVEAAANFAGLTIRDGRAVTGGCIFVGSTGALVLKECVIANGLAEQWGGGVDVGTTASSDTDGADAGGSLEAIGCLFTDNTTDSSLGFGGGAVSLYTNKACLFTNCTFSGNLQAAPNGIGGGGLYVENLDPRSALDIGIAHCTFRENSDVAGRGSSICSNVFGTSVDLTNSVLADRESRNLEVLGSGRVKSFGGNLSNDSTRAFLNQGGQPQAVYLLDDATDKTLTDPLLEPLQKTSGPTKVHPLVGVSPAVGSAVSPVAEADQLRVLRDAAPDSGAAEFGAFTRLIINEIHFNPDPADTGDAQFVEIYNPRESDAINLNGVRVCVDGVDKYTFGSLMLAPGRGVVVADKEVSFADGQPIANYSGTVNVAPVTVTASGHGLVTGTTVRIADYGGDPSYNGDHEVTVLTGDTFTIDIPYRDNNATKGTWSVANPTPVVELASGSLELGVRGSVTLKRGSETLAAVDYVGVFGDPFDTTDPIRDWDIDHSSITLVPQFVGHVYLPNSGADGDPFGGLDPSLPAGPTSPGADSGGTPFGLPNGFPKALPDVFVTDEDHPLLLDVLGNDFDADRLDVLEITTPGTPRAIANFTGAPGSFPVTVSVPGHGLAAGDYVLISGYGGDRSYNGGHVVTSATNNTFTIPVRYMDNDPVKGFWAPALTTSSGAKVAVRQGTPLSVLYDPTLSVAGPASLKSLAVGQDVFDTFNYVIRDTDSGGSPKVPSAPSQTQVTVKVLGVNDPPEPVADAAETFEDSPATLFADAHLLNDDRDPDSDYSPDRLFVVGVVDSVSTVQRYRGVRGQSPVIVEAPGHGLSSGDGILIARYGGDPSYNGYHVATVIDADIFSIPVAFIDDHIARGWWAPVDDSNRLQATSPFGASVQLEIRTNRAETKIVYDPRLSPALDRLPRFVAGDPQTMAADSFYYVVEDQHGGANFSRVSMTVKGVNDLPEPEADPNGLVSLDPILQERAGDPENPTLAELAALLEELDIRSYFGAGDPRRALVSVQHPDSSVGVVRLNLFVTDQNTPLTIPAVGAPVSAYSGTPAAVPVTVTSPGHGLQSGMGVIIEGYGGAPTYNGAHSITVLDDNNFTIPIRYVDNDAAKGRWRAEGSLVGNDFDIDEGEMLTVSAATPSREGAATTIDPNRTAVLAGRPQTITYDPTASSSLRALAREEAVIDTFVYTVRDGPGGTATSLVAVLVVGLNEQPVAAPDYRETREDSVLLIDSPVLTERGGVTLSVPQIGVVSNDHDDDIDGNLPDNILTLLPSPIDPATGTRIPEPTAISGVTVLRNLDGSILYDPTGSALVQSLPAGAVMADMFPYTIIDNSFVFANNDFLKVRADGADYRLDVLSNDATLTGGTRTANQVAGYAGVQGAAPVTVQSPAHGLANGSHILLSGHAGSPSYDGYHMVTVLDADSFSIPIVFAGDDPQVERGLWKESLEIVGLGQPDRGGSAEVIGLDGLPVDLGDPGHAPAVAIRYTPPVNFAGDEVLSYEVRDARGGTDTAFVTVRSIVDQLNGNLQVNADFYDVAMGESSILDVLANDNVLPDGGEALTIQRVVDGPAHGTAELVDNTIVYTPNPGFDGADTLTYRANGGGPATADAVVSIEVIDRSQVLALQLRDDAFSVTSNGVANVLDVLANDEIVSGAIDRLRIVDVTAATLGTVAVNEDGSALLYTPTAGVVGTETLTYIATDDVGGTNTAEVMVTIGQLVTNCDYFTVEADPASFYDLDVLANDGVSQSPEDDLTLDGDPVAVGSATGTIEAFGNLVRYTPAASTMGEQVFTYRVRDSSNNTATCTVIINVINSGLVANTDNFTVLRDSSANAFDVLRNDTVIPVGGNPVSLVSVGTGLEGPDQGGSAAIGPVVRDGESVLGILYEPVPGFVGEETFTYTITDGINGTDTTTVVVRVTGGDFDANPDFFTVFYEAPDAGAEPNAFRLPVLSNDVVLPNFGEVLSIAAVGAAPDQGGAVTVSPDGLSLVYSPADPAPARAVTETFTYEISDGTTRRAEASVTVEVLDRLGARNMDTNDDRFTVLADSAANILRVLENDGIKPAGSEGITITGVSGYSAGGFATVSGATLRYTPPAGFVGEESFQYQISDGLGGTGSGTVTVRVGDVRVSADHYAADSATAGHVLDVLSNDDILPGILPGEFALAITDADAVGSAGGTVAIVDNALVYSAQPPANVVYPYFDTFTYTVEDVSGTTFTAEVTVEVHLSGSDRDTEMVTVTVVGVNDAPTISGTMTQSINDNVSTQPFSNVTIGEIDEDGGQLLRVGITLDGGGGGTLSGAFRPGSDGFYFFEGTAADATAAIRGLTFTPDENSIPAGENATTTLTVQIDDGSGQAVTDASTRTNVVAVNDPPVIAGTRSDLRVHYKETILPFASVTITDPDTSATQPLVVRVILGDAALGTLAGAGFVPVSASIYEFMGSAAEASAAIRELVFAPSPNAGVTQVQSVSANFTITAADGLAPVVVDRTTSVEVRHSYESRIVPADPELTASEFGTAVQVEGTTLAVGAPKEDADAADGGAVYLYRSNSGAPTRWVEDRRIAPADPVPGGFFGQAIALSGDLLAVGAPGDDDLGSDSGSVYVYGRDQGGPGNWGLLKKVTAPDGAAAAQFGSSVALDGIHLVVGAPFGRRTSGAVSGVAYVFLRHGGGFNNWGQVAKLQSSNGGSADQFGISVGVSGDVAAVGAWGNDGGASESGAAYVFHQSAGGAGNWGEVRVLFSDAPRESDVFGFALALEGDDLLVGAPGDRAQPSGARSGSALLFQRNSGGPDNWGRVHRFDEPVSDQAGGEAFGGAVAIEGDRVVIGAYADNAGGADDRFGAFFTYQRHRGGPGAWGFCDKVTEVTRDAGELLGLSVDVDFHTVVAGSPQSFGDGAAPRPRTGAVLTTDYKWNDEPQAVLAAMEVETIAEQPFLYRIPDGVFGEPDRPDSISVSVAAAGGGAIPSWLVFDAGARTLAGTPAEGTPDANLTLTGTDADGETASYDLRVGVLPGGPYLYNTTVTGVDNTSWTTVMLPRTYTSMVVVATPVYGRSSPPLVSRMRSAASGDSFDLRVQRADGSAAPVSGIDVQVVVVEAGVYTEAAHGVKLEARRYTSDSTARAGRWSGEAQLYQNNYTTPVVLGQVMSYNDAAFSVFWSRGSDRFTAPASGLFFTGKHVGEDSDISRAPEQVGFIVLDAGSGRMRAADGLRGFVAGRVLPELAREDAPARPLDFATSTIAPHGGGSNNSIAGVFEDGKTLLVAGGGWQSVGAPVTLTDASVLEFDFLSKVQGSVHAIGFDNDASLSGGSSYQLYGTGSFGRQNYNNYPGDGTFVSYRIPVGSFFSGSFNRFTFGATNGGLASGVHSYFRSVTIRSGGLRPFLYPRGLTGAQTAVLSMQAMPENDGGWPVLAGSLSGVNLPIAIDEDTIGDAERSHALQQVGYLVIGPAGGAIPVTADPDSTSGLYRQWLAGFYPQSVLDDPSLEASVWGFSADGDGDGQPAGMEYTLGGDPANFASTIEPFTIIREPGGDVAVRYRYRSNDPSLEVNLLTSVDGQLFEVVTDANSKTIETTPDGDFTTVIARFEPTAAGQGPERLFRLEARYSSIGP